MHKYTEKTDRQTDQERQLAFYDSVGTVCNDVQGFMREHKWKGGDVKKG